MNQRSHKSVLFYTAILVSIALAACSSDKQSFEGRLNAERKACTHSDGTYDAGDGIQGDSICMCGEEEGSQIECYSSWVCDAKNYTCRQCVEGDTKCENNKTSKCMDGKWTKPESCDTGDTCSNDGKRCVSKTECNETCTDGNILKQCHNEDGQITYTKTLCPNGCNDNPPKCNDCNEDYNYQCKDGVITYCANKTKHEVKCWSGACSGNQCVIGDLGNNNPNETCEDNASRCGMIGTSYVQQQCVNGHWKDIQSINCNSCTPDGSTCTCNEDNEIKECTNNTLYTYTCENGVWKIEEDSNSKCTDDNNTDDLHCEDPNKIIINDHKDGSCKMCVGEQEISYSSNVECPTSKDGKTLDFQSATELNNKCYTLVTTYNGKTINRTAHLNRNNSSNSYTISVCTENCDDTNGCISNTCQNDTYQCNNNSLEYCNSGEWEQVQNCPNGCNRTQTGCESDPSVDSKAIECTCEEEENNSMKITCNQNGTPETLVSVSTSQIEPCTTLVTDSLPSNNISEIVSALAPHQCYSIQTPDRPGAGINSGYFINRGIDFYRCGSIQDCTNCSLNSKGSCDDYNCFMLSQF